MFQYKDILDDQIIRYEESYPWYALHRPRDIRIFESNKKIICPYRSKVNYFSIATEPVFSSRDVFFITPKSDDLSLEDMKFIVGILNSKTYYYWLFNMGKRKGDILELYYKPLSEIPILIPSMELKDNIIKIVNELDNGASSKNVIDMIDNYLYNYYAFTELEINEIEKIYDSNK